MNNFSKKQLNIDATESILWLLNSINKIIFPISSMVLSIHRRNISYESVGQVIVHVPTMFASFLPLELSIKRNNPLILYNFKLERLLNINLCTIWYERLVKLQLQMPWSLVILLGGCCWFCWGFFRVFSLDLMIVKPTIIVVFLHNALL